MCMRAPAIVRMFEFARRAWRDDDALRLGASLAYYTLFAIAPILLVATALAGMVFGAEAVRGEIVITSSEARVSMLVSLIVTTALFALLGTAGTATAAVAGLPPLHFGRNTFWILVARPRGARSPDLPRVRSSALLTGVIQYVRTHVNDRAGRWPQASMVPRDTLRCRVERMDEHHAEAKRRFQAVGTPEYVDRATLGPLHEARIGGDESPEQGLQIHGRGRARRARSTDKRRGTPPGRGAKRVRRHPRQRRGTRFTRSASDGAETGRALAWGFRWLERLPAHGGDIDIHKPCKGCAFTITRIGEKLLARIQQILRD